MERSHFLAKLIGPVFIVGGVGMLFNTAVYRVMFERALETNLQYRDGACRPATRARHISVVGS